MAVKRKRTQGKKKTAKRPRLAFVHLDDVPWQEVLTQLHGNRRVSVRNKFLEWTPKRMVAYTRYEPGMVIERHGHASDHLVFVVEGHVDVGERPCPAGTLVVLEHGARFGPLVAGPKGAILLEVWMGNPAPVPTQSEAFEKILRDEKIILLPRPKFTRPRGAGPTRRGRGAAARRDRSPPRGRGT